MWLWKLKYFDAMLLNTLLADVCKVASLGALLILLWSAWLNPGAGIRKTVHICFTGSAKMVSTVCINAH